MPLSSASTSISAWVADLPWCCKFEFVVFHLILTCLGHSFFKHFSCIALCYFSVTFKLKFSPSRSLVSIFVVVSVLWIHFLFSELLVVFSTSVHCLTLPISQSWPVGAPRPSSHCGECRDKLSTVFKPLRDPYRKHLWNIHHTIMEEKPNFLLNMNVGGHRPGLW